MHLKKSIPSELSDRKSRFLLIVDSDADSLFFTSRLLQRFSYKTYTATTGKDALSIMSVTVPALIIAALRLKDMKGHDLIRRMHECVTTACVPIIALKGRNDILEENLTAQGPAIRFIEKPVAVEPLYRAVQAALEKTPRQNIRIPTFLPIQALGSQLDCLENACTTNLSEQGMFIRTKNPAVPKTRLSCQVHLHGEVINVEASVLYQKNRQAEGEASLERGMGVEFIEISTKDRELIRRYIRNEITRGIMPGSPHA